MEEIPMNTPSNANTSGLEVVAWRSTWVGLTGRTVHQLHQREAEAIRSAKWMEGATFEPLVTAASAQARIAELEALVESYRRTVDLEARDGDAAEARADRLAKALKRIAHPEYGLGFNKLRGIARAALQPETQP
jgi:hypothetical protein